MSYKTIVAYIDDPERCGSLIGIAKSLAARHEAHLIGLHVVPNIQVYAAADAGMMTEVWETERRQFEETASAAKDFFVDAIKDVRHATEWRRVEQGAEMVGDRVAEHGLVADLVITGQIDPDIESPRRAGTPERVLMQGGRPLLMVPYAGTFPAVGEHVMIAWKPTGEAARAVFDALPLLMAADRVTILSIDPDDGAEQGADGEALAAALARHGVNAGAVSAHSGDIGVGATILSRLADANADLLVMGGYGHARFTEYLFGGATRDILRQMTVPVLISH